MGEKSFFGALFDLSFTSFIVPKIVKFSYVLSIIIWAIVMIAGIWYSQRFGILDIGVPSISRGLVIALILIGTPLVFLLLVIIDRIVYEILVVIFRIAEDISKIAGQREIRK